jgi:hypothetical protein
MQKTVVGSSRFSYIRRRPMASDWRAPGTRRADDGVRITRTRGISPVLPSVVLLGVVGWLIARTLRSDAPPPVPPPPREVHAAPRAPAATPAPVPVARDPEVAESMRQRREERQQNRRDKSEVPFTLNAHGEQVGISAFPPPGTKPIKRGVVVPDDYELPEGYVRHYQTTDDGRPLPPILMFHPDFAGVDADGNPLVVPEDRIVPPELAPAGLQPRTLDETTDVDERVRRRVHADTPPPAVRR